MTTQELGLIETITYIYDEHGNLMERSTSGAACQADRSVAKAEDFEYIPGPGYHVSPGHESPEGLFENNARCYDAATARWLTQDPLGFEAGDTNLYRYCVSAQGQLLPEK
jgi:RHS repeat-associated protein